MVALLFTGCAHGPKAVSAPDPQAESLQIRLVSNAATPEPPDVNAPDEPSPYGDYTDEEESLDYPEEEAQVDVGKIADPIEPFNRAMYHFNDRLYFWVLKPVAEGYSKVVPEPARVSVSNFFSNLWTPVRLANCLLQLNPMGALTELFRFWVNTTIGVAGFFDPASSEEINLQAQDEDFGQTLGFYGVGQGFYIVWPVLGPSSPRDTLGRVGDYFTYPISYLDPWYVWTAVRGYEAINDTSLRIGDYEALKDAAIDPYVAMRDFYVQYRQKRVEARGTQPKPVSEKEAEGVRPTTPTGPMDRIFPLYRQEP
ncbi:MAG TPA: VacJ family lipoprotein [Syntrophales bacterium]|nr:VacJ family lipoprotein [Syntrophales bacterium]HOX94010.1 VacJ family lipoprotein [Syntrophales bacterium]HPI56362.1 VacJ family lipoprotein [Syntrophales bacterium]HPN24250.1 VacJ family lipoprotein [Syntrophales bacterium]HQM28603.1 VacJ family lipoprotein [Syntrophales bacterium]